MKYNIINIYNIIHIQRIYINIMNIIYFDQAMETYKKVDLIAPIRVKPRDRIMIPKTANTQQIEWVKTYLLPSQTRYTLFERDPYLVFFFV